MTMSKNQFRAVIILSLLAAVIAGVYDYIWPDPIAEKIFDYIIKTEPELEGTKYIVVIVLGFIVVIMAIVSFVGLLRFKSWSRHVYSAGFVCALFLYPFMGVTVYSGISQIFYDLSMVLSGVVLALVYYSPVAEYYKSEV